jgi:hypothetical protein
VEIEERTEEVVVIDESDSEDELDYYSFVAPDSPEPEMVSWKQQGRDLGLVHGTHTVPQQNRPLHRKSLSGNTPLARLPDAHLAPPVAHPGQLVLARPHSHASPYSQHGTVIDLTEDSDDRPSIPEPYQVVVATEQNAQSGR